MAVSGKFYGAALKSAFNKEIDADSDTLKVMLCSSSYTPNLDTHDYKNDVTNELATAGGYTQTGASLTSVTMVWTAANSWATARANSTVYAAGQYVRPATGNGYLYMAAVGGTSAGSIPTYPTVIGQTVTDGGVTWVCVGTGAFVLDAADVSWSGATFTARYAVIYDSTPATDATRPLIGLIDFGADVSPVAAAFTLTWAADGIIVLAL